MLKLLDPAEVTSGLSADMMTEADADKLMKQAKKLSEPSLLTMRLKGDWEQATPLYEKAAGLYRVNGPLTYSTPASS